MKSQGRARLFGLMLTAVSVVGSSDSIGQAQPSIPRADAAVAGEWPLPSGFEYPNGIARAADGTLFVGLVTSGHILRRAPEGGWSVFFAGSAEVYAGTSLRLDPSRGLLWGASPDFLPGSRARPHRVFALDSNTAALRHVLELPDGGFGNDLAVAPNGTVFVTDSRNGRVLRLRPGEGKFETVVEHADLKPVDGIGVGGIAWVSADRLALGNFGAGRLLVVEEAAGASPRVRPLELPRRLENPDGMAISPDGSLLVLEGAVASGNGKLLRVRDPFLLGVRPLEVVRDQLPSPLNLTLSPNGDAFVTLSRIRHRLIAGRESDKPQRYGVLAISTTSAEETAPR